MMLLSKAYCIRSTLSVIAILGVGVGGALAYAPRKAIKWEYNSLKRVELEKLAPQPTEPETGAAIYEGQNAENLSQGLTALGNEGWELVAIEPYHQESYKDPGTGFNVTMHHYPTYVFKRQK